MTLSYLHNLIEDGAKLLEGEDLLDSFGAAEAGHPACTPFYQDIKNCLEFLTQSIVELRYHLTNMPILGTERSNSSDGGGVPFRGIEMDGEEELKERWISMSDKVSFSFYVNTIESSSCLTTLTNSHAPLMSYSWLGKAWQV